MLTLIVKWINVGYHRKEESVVATYSVNSGCSQCFCADCVELRGSNQRTSSSSPPQHRADRAICDSRTCEMVGRLHVLRKLRAFYVDPLLLLRLYRSIIEPLLTNCSICYYPALSVKNRNRLLKISHVSAKIIGLPTPKLSEIIDHAILKKARAVATESDHPLSTFFHVLPSQRRYRCIKCKTCRYSRSFVPVAIRMLNAK